MKKLALWVIEFVVTTLIEMGTLALGWNVFLCMAWDSLPSMTFTQIVLTAVGMKFVKFSLIQWYKRKE